MQVCQNRCQRDQPPSIPAPSCAQALDSSLVPRSSASTTQPARRGSQQNQHRASPQYHSTHSTHLRALCAALRGEGLELRRAPRRPHRGPVLGRGQAGGEVGDEEDHSHLPVVLHARAVQALQRGRKGGRGKDVGREVGCWGWVRGERGVKRSTPRALYESTGARTRAISSFPPSLLSSLPSFPHLVVHLREAVPAGAGGEVEAGLRQHVPPRRAHERPRVAAQRAVQGGGAARGRGVSAGRLQDPGC